MLAMQSVLTDPIRSSLQQLEVSPEYVPVLELVCLTEGDDSYLGEIWECRTPRVIMGDRGDADREHHESHCHIQIVADLISTLSHTRAAGLLPCCRARASGRTLLQRDRDN